MNYTAPQKDMLFVIRELAGLADVGALPGFEDATADTARAVLEENARFVEDVVAPLNRTGDVAPPSWNDGVVTTSKGFKEAFASYAAAGWQGVQHDVRWGGQGLPKLIATPCIEMLNGANLSFALCPLLTDGAIEALMTAGSDAQKESYLANLVEGRWTGTMNLTEPQAGSDLALVRTRAEAEPDGRYRLFGQKIYITYGEHDMADNIVHLVLARTAGAPEGVKGISLFTVPKRLVDADGSPGARNDVYCASIEHKLGIKASPTAVLLFGDGKFPVEANGRTTAGALGELVGEENRGLEYMFVMMNAARFAVGVQGIAVSERAYQQAAAFAKDRRQSRDLAGSSGPVTIVHHPDVRRMLMTMRALTEGARALAYVTAAAQDTAHRHADADVRRRNTSLYEYLVPVVKGWSTERSIEIASLGVQVHGGMGFIEETGAAQHYRDARILTIYEGTTAIQANDLVGRKTVRDGGATANALVDEVRATAGRLAASGVPALEVIGRRLSSGADALADVVAYVVGNVRADIKGVFAGSVPYLELAGIVLAGWQMARAAEIATTRLAASDVDDYGADFLEAKRATARFFADHVLSRARGLRDGIVDGSESVMALEEAQF